MGYLSNSGTITVDAILTKKGRELLAKGQGSFNITQFALSDDEVDYDLWNPQHGLGSDYFGIVIENMPVTEAVPDETQSMKYKLITLPPGTKAIPYLQEKNGLTSVSVYSQGYLGNSATTYPVTKLIEIGTYQYTGAQTENRMDAEAQTYTVTILDSTYIEIATESGLLNTTKAESRSGNSITYSTIGDTVLNGQRHLNFTVRGKAVPTVPGGVETTKSTKIIITNEKYGSRLVLPASYTY